MDQRENWRPVQGWEGLYEVSDLGRVRSLSREVRFGPHTRITPSVILAPQPHSCGYRVVMLKRPGKQKTAYVHLIVAEAFLPQPIGKKFVNHVNEDKTDNEVGNLEWCTRRHNTRHFLKGGLRTTLPRMRIRKLDPEHVLEIRSQRPSKNIMLASDDLAKTYGVTPPFIRDIWRGKAWSYLLSPN